MGGAAQAVTHAVSNVVDTVKTVVTNPTKANIGQIAAVVNPVTLTAPIDAAQHKEDIPILAAATTAAIGGAYAAGLPTAAATGTAAGGTATVAGALTTLGKTAGAAQAINSIEQALNPPSPNPPPTVPIVGPPPPPDFGISGGGGAGGGVWSTGGGGGSGNIYANPFQSLTTTPGGKTGLWISAALFAFIILAVMQKKGR